MRSRSKRSQRRGAFDLLEVRQLLSLVLSPFNITATKQVPFNGVVATLIDSHLNSSPSDFNNPPGSVQINWGDGQTGSGQIVGPIFPGVFEVDASHTYASSGSFSAQITVTDQAGDDAIANAVATVTSGSHQLTIVANDIAGTANQSITAPVANFLDPNAADTSGDFQALITWGDGNTSIGTIQGGNGVFTVSGTNTYGSAGTFATNVTVIGLDNGLSGFATGTATIASVSPYDITGQQFIETAGASFKATVATFTDTNPSDPSSDFSALVDWGDGHTSQGTITGENGSFSIAGSHVYTVPGTYAVMVTLNDQSDNTTSTTSTATVTGPVLTPIPTTVTPLIGQPFTGIVASFFDTNTSDTLNNLSATITWGNGNITTGTVLQAAGTPELFNVQGTNNYATAGTYPVSVLIVNTDGQSATAASTAIVAAPTIVASGTTFPVTPGVALPNIVVANFIDTDPNATAQNIKAAISWGDGQTSVGVVNKTGASGIYTVSGSHTYSAPGAAGSFSVTVTIADPNGQTAKATSTALIAGFINASGTSITATLGQLLTNVTVANFTDSNPAANAGNITAVIGWGDGHTSPGTISGPNAAGNFTVSGNHTYTAAIAGDAYLVSVDIADPSGQVATVTGTTIIAAPPINAIGTTFPATLGQPLTNLTVANFTDSNPNAGTITAVIKWGDGQTSTGAVNGPNASGIYTVMGNHTYFAASASGSYAVTVTIADSSGQTAMASGTANVVSPVITPIGTTITPKFNQPLPSNTIIASFLDATDSVSNLHATITWGDGNITPGIVTLEPGTDRFDVSGSNTYRSPGTFSISVLLVNATGQSATATSTAIVAASVLTPIPMTVNFTAGVAPSSPVTVGSFFDSTPKAQASNLTASINWGNGQQTTAGTVTASPTTPGLFIVSGTYLYASAGTNPISIVVQDNLGNSTTILSTAVVAQTPVLTPGQPLTVSFTVGVPPSTAVTLGSFFDSNTIAAASNFVATIMWGTGQVTLGTVTASSTTPGLFLVSGTNLYSAPGTYPISIGVQDSQGNSTVVSGTASVVTNVVTALAGFGFTGGLALGAGNGPFAAEGYTNTNQPTLTGTALPFSIVQLYARPFGVDTELPLGEAVTNSAGQWSLTAGPLLPGTYTIAATVTPPGGYPSTLTALTNAGLVHIDMKPKKPKALLHHWKALAHHKTLVSRKPVHPHPAHPNHRSV